MGLQYFWILPVATSVRGANGCQKTISFIYFVEVPCYCAAPAAHVLVPWGVPDGQAGPHHLSAGLGARCLRRLHQESTVYSLFATFKSPV
jgi:hypothetical protein